MNKDELFAKDKLVFPEDRNIIFRSKDDVCSLFGISAVKRGYQEQSFYKLNDTERIWLVKESTEFENHYIDDFYPNYIKEIRDYNQKEFVEDALKSPKEKRYVFRKISKGYEFYGTYMLDVEKTTHSLEEDIPTRYWNKISDEVILTSSK